MLCAVYTLKQNHQCDSIRERFGLKVEPPLIGPREASEPFDHVKIVRRFICESGSELHQAPPNLPAIQSPTFGLSNCEQQTYVVLKLTS